VVKVVAMSESLSRTKIESPYFRSLIVSVSVPFERNSQNSV
jgi:hypothetical protein